MDRSEFTDNEAEEFELCDMDIGEEDEEQEEEEEMEQEGGNENIECMDEGYPEKSENISTYESSKVNTNLRANIKITYK